MTATYKLKLGASGPFVGCESREEIPLIDYGYTDEEWDELSESKRDNLLDEWAQEFMLNEGYECWGDVTNG